MNEDSSSQIGYRIILMEDLQNCNIIYYSSSKSRRIARSALAAELFALVNGFDHSSTMRLAIDDILNCQVPLSCTRTQNVCMTE